ncbi:unnamed protein product [Mytilus coruscus]|uniref:Uncharacterized protein n=1 Tax=Mytilus coruscus TaxID=42192 RepID=A0A6J8CV59_MYTCO|nr:unnamed protein product [Mytilus coruscus]
MAGVKGFEFVLLIVFLMICHVESQVTHKLDNSTDNECNKILTIHPDEEIILTSSGRAPKAFCTALVYALGKGNKKCHGMCMSVTSQFIDLCDAKVQFTGMDFGHEDDPLRELSCFHKLPTEWCFQTNTMTVEIVETHFYAFQMKKLSYNFSVKVSPVCDDSPFGKDIQAREDARKASEAGARSMARIHGILVGVCLAIVFLIVLLITWCYYKNKPFRRDIHNYPTAHVRKGPTFAGFKAKMTFHKPQSPDEGANETKPKKEKKRKHSKDEASLENEEAKPKKRGGLKFLNKLRSHRAEEVPLVEKKDDKDPARVAEKIEDEINEILEDENVDNKLEKDNRSEDNRDTEKDAEKLGNDTEDTNKPDLGDAAESGDKEEKTSSEPVPSVTVTAAGENDSKNDSSDDS